MRTLHGIVLSAKVCADSLGLKGNERRQYLRNFVENVFQHHSI